MPRLSREEHARLLAALRLAGELDLAAKFAGRAAVPVAPGPRFRVRSLVIRMHALQARLDGQEAPLTPQIAELFAILADRRGEPMALADLADRLNVWPARARGLITQARGVLGKLAKGGQQELRYDPASRSVTLRLAVPLLIAA